MRGETKAPAENASQRRRLQGLELVGVYAPSRTLPSRAKGCSKHIASEFDHTSMRTITLPSRFSFRDHDVHDFTSVLTWFDWNIENEDVIFDFRQCRSANYQALALIVPYVWHLKLKNRRIYFDHLDDHDHHGSASRMWALMGARGWSHVLFQPAQNFKGHDYKPLIAIRHENDFKTALTRAEEYTRGFDVEYEKTLRYVVSELLYNTMEHGSAWYQRRAGKLRCPSVIQFTWYESRNEISIIVADLGVGIKRHLENAYPAFPDHISAIRHSIKPQVSGTFGPGAAYTSSDNAGVGLFLSSSIIQKLRADMFIVSGNGVLHISPRDTTGRTVDGFWPGTFVLITLRLSRHGAVQHLKDMLAEFRDSARKELVSSDMQDLVGKQYVSIENYFGRFAENKIEAISFRDRYLLPALSEGKSLHLDFTNVVSSPHSFLNALLSTPIRILGLNAYKRLKVTNAAPEIRETIDYILDENTREIGGEIA